ncbi:ATP-grasp domain-containing protein [Hahella sp. HN01]|uniref:ATP-grasp domain-containing protein n=1 Tax=Hahella sp. HN01 TaxID=2847262 RepID=UPI001C1EB857|nr:ATP-grasp domain-containing protein [Hahella sp. HN01]MBU6954036.1 ATP-grasp domain-containing protein [Hahella sp. HN01]
MGLQPVNSPDEFLRASELSHWLPYIKDMTPKTLCVEQFPVAESIEVLFGWPVFIKGSRQTSRHNPELSIAHGPDDYQRIVDSYQRDKILHWQKIAIREFIPLEPVSGGIPGKISPSQEYRTFWWHGECVGYGRYWPSDYSAPDLKQGLQLAQEAAERLKVPFMVIDIAKTRQGHWIIIECNDAQESGYASIPPLQLWRNILEQVKSNSQADH